MKTLKLQSVDPWPPVPADGASATFVTEGALVLAVDGVASNGAQGDMFRAARCAVAVRSGAVLASAVSAAGGRPATTKRSLANGRRNPITDTGTNRPPLIPPERSSP